MLLRSGQVGLGLLWLTGIIMVWTMFGGPGNLPPTFWIKFVLVLAVTAMVALLSITVRRVQGGDRSAAARLPLYGGVSGALLLLTVIFAVVALQSLYLKGSRADPIQPCRPWRESLERHHHDDALFLVDRQPRGFPRGENARRLAKTRAASLLLGLLLRRP